MPMVTYKPLHPEANLGAANSNNFAFSSNVSGAPLARVINTGATSVLHFYFANGVEYANLTIFANNEVIVKKNQPDKLQGNNMLATDVAYLY
jgi:hypothetical protein